MLEINITLQGRKLSPGFEWQHPVLKNLTTAKNLLDTYGQGSSTVFIKNLPPLPPYEKRIAEGQRQSQQRSVCLVTHTKVNTNNGLGTH